ncbi:BRO domain protein [Cereibacter sphaeroides WS8N]|uniref:BRO-N domain-containing protein n=1 Tax=Cereibacter sphaeroides TaxID=1063 RepID=UPI00020B0314|nr:Bro-N domain-containing protein [Cereibacter sphaeroides]EGJ20083.1 BRO domain protein [Cereibacter sphaeroides WS8N]
MSAELIPFDFEDQPIRTLLRDGSPWWVAADVCRVLEIQNPTDAVKRLDDDEVTLDTIEGSHRPTNLISESGLYALVLASRKPAAKRFRKWITSEVLPALRMHGRYEMPGAGPQMHEISADRLLELLQSENELLRSKIPPKRAPRRAPVPLTGEEKAEILRLVHAGLSVSQIARLTGRSTSAVSLLRSGFRVIDGGGQ